MKLGILGYPLTYTQSPKLHERFLRKARLSGSYAVLPFDPALGPKAFKNYVQELKAQGYAGLNVTVPLKEWAYEVCKTKSGRPAMLKGFEGRCASAVGAVNTLSLTGRTPRGANTDAPGFWVDAGKWLRLKRVRVFDTVIVGTGGAARGVLAGILCGHPATRGVARVIIWGRDAAKARELRRMLLTRRPEASAGGPEPSGACLVVWCLPPMKTADARTVLAKALEPYSSSRVYLYDLNYGDRASPTRPLVPRSRHRCGEGMLFEQARLSFELWMKTLAG